MPDVKYLLIGSSHAALEALRAIRMVDAEGSMAMLTKDDRLPYSPTILPYVMSGRSSSEAVVLRDEAFFAANNCTFVPRAEAVSLDAKARRVTLAGGEVWRYERLLIATGAAPAIPPVKGLESAPHHVLRSLADAEGLRAAMKTAKSAVVLGAGLVGLHAAETMAEAGLKVTVVEMQGQVLPGYFDAKASSRIESAFAAHGVDLRLGCRVDAVNEGRITLNDGSVLEAELLLVAAGVRPGIDWLKGSGVALDRGVLVDEAMRAGVDGVWAAGDVAQALDFAAGKPALIGIIPTAVEQGKIAGQGMADDAGRKAYPGGLPVNTYRFFGRVALSIGRAVAAANDDVDVEETEEEGGYRRMVFQGGRLVGFASIDQPFDVGIMGELIRRRVDLGGCRAAFAARPTETARRLMSELWR